MMNCNPKQRCCCSHGNSISILIITITFICFIIITILTAVISTTDLFERNLVNFSTSIFPTFNQTSPSSCVPLINSSSTLQSSSNYSTSSSPNLRILIGILTIPDQSSRRSFLRQIYNTPSQSQSQSTAQIDIKFILCKINDDQTLLITLEILNHNDIIILNCTENMNKGKTYTFFSSLPLLFSTNPYHYVMKADDDTYIRFPKLIASLTPLPRKDLYYGFVIPCESTNPFKKYMSGMGYLVSWDIVEWVSESNLTRKHRDGPEDRVFGDWMSWGERGKNRYNAKWEMFNYPVLDVNGKMHKCSHELWNGTIAVHLLKTKERWVNVLRYFNVTDGFVPSQMYSGLI